MSILVIDCETTGLPQRKSFMDYYDYQDVDRYASSRIVSIAWVVLDENLGKHEEQYYIVRPNGFVIPTISTQIHGISNVHAIKNGISINDAITKFQEVFTKYPYLKYVVGHNIEFDLHVIKSEMYRAKTYDVLDDFNKLSAICTMKLGKNLMPQSKFPRLVDLYKICAPESRMDNAHHALHDCHYCSECLVHMVKLGIVTL